MCQCQCFTFSKQLVNLWWLHVVNSDKPSTLMSCLLTGAFLLMVVTDFF